MTDINTRGKLPFTVVSSSVNTGYAAELTSSVGYNIDIVNHHKDEYGGIKNSPLQGPFTNQHVGGNQYRHVKLNDGTDNSDNRPEGYIISASVGSVKIYGPDVKGVHRPRSLLTRDTTAKSPVNIKNIETSGNIAGNFEHNYQVVQSVGRRTSNNLIVDGFEANGSLTTQFIRSPVVNAQQAFASIEFLGIQINFYSFVIGFDSGKDLRVRVLVNQPSTQIIEDGKDITLSFSTPTITVADILDLVEIVANWTSGVPKFGADSSAYPTDTFYPFDYINFVYGVDGYYLLDYDLPNITRIDAEGKQYKDKTIFVERFNAPGGKEETSRRALDREGEEYAPNNSLTTRNIKVRQPFYNQLTQHSAQFNSGSTYKLLPDTGSIDATTIHGVNRNTLQKVFITGTSYFTGSKYDNFWVQHAIPRTDLRYRWIANSISSSQQPIEYQSYNLPYSTSSFYNSNGAFNDLSFELTGPFGDHLGISGAIDKDEMFVSAYTNTMYRDRKQFRFFSNGFYIDLSKISSDISKRDFTISFWAKIPSSMPANGPYTFLQYSGSLGENQLKLYCIASEALSSWAIENSTIPSEYQIKNYEQTSNFNDNKWHLITITSDKTTLLPRISGITAQVSNTTLTKVYVDGGLVYEKQQKFTNFDISKIHIRAGLTTYDNTLIDEIMIWDSFLEEEQINKIYRASKSEYGQRPKKYIEHKLENTNVRNPIHVYSSRTNEVANILFDEVGTKNATLVDYTSSINLYPQLNKIISYSTYFNGPYQGASWKSIRNAEHPITRKLTTENTNIVSVVIPEGQRDVYRNVNGNQVRFTLPDSRKQGTILNIKESPVYINNKPLKHKFILKDSADQNVGFELTHTYGNNLQYFANKQLNDTLGLGKKERQIYDTLFDYYNGNVDENENPIERLVGYTYSETVFPKSGQALLKDVRQRTDYITVQPGFSADGYDRQLGTQRVFWRDSQENRMRTRKNCITSLGDQLNSEYDLPFQTPSVAALEYVSEGIGIQYIKNDNPGPLLESILDTSYKNCAELNNGQMFSYHSYGYLGPGYTYYTLPAVQIPEIYFFKDDSLTSRDENYNVVLASGLYPLQSSVEPSSLKILPTLFYKHPSIISDRVGITDTTALIYNNNTNDLGLNRFTEKISGKKPWYDSYEEYYVDIKALSNDNLISYSRIPEFKISDKISQLIINYNGDIRKINLEEYVDDLEFTYKNSIDNNNKITEEDTINIFINSVKKLLPYNGFYPQDRSLQLVNYLKQSYLDTNAIGGGLLLTRSLGEYVFREQNDKLVQFMKESAFLEPLYSPGIFYNLIKSGISVDWSIYTGSVPANRFVVPLLKKPEYKISFESLLNLQNIPLSSSNQNFENRMMKHKEVSFGLDAGDYNLATDYNFQGFFEKLGEGLPIYTLAINNFLAETINFFLKDSVLNTFISKPDSDFLSFDSDKTYYMDVVLRKNDIVMCEAHSSSLADNFGKMSGRYFGPAFWSGSNADASRINTEYLLSETLRDPAYCAYTPPYYYGDSIARISFKPSITKKYTLDEIFEEMDIQFMNTGFMNDNIYTSGSLYSSFVMPLASSVVIQGQIESREQTVQLENLSENFSNTITRSLRNLVGTATNSTGIKKWVISPKMEVPVLDFSNQEFITSTTILTQSNTDLKLKSEPGFIHTPPTASGFGRGMWSGYGEIPEGNKGIFLELRESYPRELVGVLNPNTRQFSETNTGSLLQTCGFQSANDKLTKKIGELSDSRDISEAIIVIPYLERTSTGKNIRFGGGFSTLIVNDTVEIEGHNFIKINQNIFNYQKTNILANKPAVSLADFSEERGGGSIQETSISRMIGLMNKYVLPPNFDFLINSDIKPFVMYIAEFTSTLDKQDLADIWQGLMPKIATRSERQQQIVSHKNTQFDFFHGQGLPKDVKFLIFKAKKRAEINYYKMTADSSDDGLFPSIQAGKPPSPYSFNWPYDYCSLVEAARVDVEIEYINKSGSNNT